MKLTEILLSCLTAATFVLVLEVTSVILLEGPHYVLLLRHAATVVGLWAFYALLYLVLGVVIWALARMLLRRRYVYRRASVLLLLVFFLVPGLNAMFVTRRVIGRFMTKPPVLIAFGALALLIAVWLAVAASRKRDGPFRLVAAAAVAALAAISISNGFIILRLAGQIMSFEGVRTLGLAVLGAWLLALPMVFTCWKLLRAPAGKALTATFSFYALVCAGMVALAPTAPERPPPLATDGGRRPPSVLLIVIDTLRGDVVSGPEDPSGLTPNIGRLGRDSVWFESAFAASPWTLPSFGTIMTSVYPSRHYAGSSDPDTEFRYPLSATIPTLAGIFSEADYWSTAAATNPFLSRRFGLGRGFDVYHNLLPASSYHAVFAGVQRRGLLGERRAYLPAEEQTARVRSLIRHSTAMNRPFFILAHYMDPHSPYGAPELLGNAPRDAVDPFDRYRAEVAYCDHFIGILLDDLRAQGIYDEMMIVLTSDHGEEFFEERLGRRFEGHGHTLFNELIHIPLLVKLPGNKHGGSRRTDTVSLIDVAPTLLDAAGVTAPETFDGLTLVDEEADQDRVVFAEGMMMRPEQKAAVRGNEKVMMRELPPDLTCAEAYDLASDEHERRPLAWERAGTRFVGLYQLLEDFVYSQGTPPDTSTVDVDPHLLEQLKSLGYVTPEN